MVLERRWDRGIRRWVALARLWAARRGMSLLFQEAAHLTGWEVSAPECIRYTDSEHPDCFAAKDAVRHKGGVCSNLASYMYMVDGVYRAIQTRGVGVTKVERKRAARVAMAVTLCANGMKTDMPDPTGDGAFPVLVHRAQSLLAARSD